jgi:hypothetical protein
MAELVERYELVMFAWWDMAAERYLTGVDTGAAVRWELHHAAEELRRVGVCEHELNEIQSRALLKLAVLRRLEGHILCVLRADCGRFPYCQLR